MKKFIKFMSFAFIAVLVNVIFSNNVNASTNISVKSSSSVTVGNTITATVTISSSDLLGAWDFAVLYDTSKLSLIDSGTQHIVGYGDGVIKSKSYSFKFKAKSVGSAKIWIDSASYVKWDETNENVSKGSKTISIKEKPVVVPVTYSKDNYLSELTIESYELNPKFDKETLEYTVTLPENTQKITIEGKLSDKEASVNGLGEINLTEGDNNLEIKVTAENGNVRIYKIKAIVEEPDPIIVKVNGEDFYIVRKTDGISVPANYKETTASISGEEVLSYYGEITKYTLLALKDKSGNVNLYIYDLNNNSYILYQELKFNSLNIYPMEIEEKSVKEGFELSKITINNIEVDSLRKNNSYPLVYGMNLDTGEINFYSYDAKENTLQRFNDEQNNIRDKQLKLYFYAIIGISSFAVFELLMMIIILINKTRKTTKELNNTLAKTMQLNAIEIQQYKEKINSKNKKQIKKQLKEQKNREKQESKRIKAESKKNKKNINKDMDEL